MRFPRGTRIRELDSRFDAHGGVAEILWSEDGSDAVHGGVLDRRVRGFGESGIPGVVDQRPRYEKPAGTKERCTREPVVVKAADVRIVAQFVSPAGGDSAAANGVEVAEPARAGSRACYPAYAKGPDHHERAIGQYPERRQWGHRAGHHSRPSERRA